MHELLKPRYKVIADYPNSELQVGTVLYYTGEFWEDRQGIEFSESVKHFDKFPHLFKKMEWWEERKPEEMPEYVKCRGIYYKIHHWDETATLGWCPKERKDIRVDEYCEPATPQEYTEFINRNKI